MSKELDGRQESILLLIENLMTIIPFVPKVLLAIIADYDILFDVQFGESIGCNTQLCQLQPRTTISKDKRSISVVDNGINKHSICIHTMIAINPLCLTGSQWSFHVNHFREVRYIAFGICDPLEYTGKGIVDRCNGKPYFREVASNIPQFIKNIPATYSFLGEVNNKKMRDATEKSATSETLTITETISSIITFNADFVNGSVSVTINGKQWHSIFSGIENLSDWKPYVIFSTDTLGLTVQAKTMQIVIVS